ncbi:MAG: pyridoxal-phosphate-dependent aminotransferase family protein [Opitutales bacterium]
MGPGPINADPRVLRAMSAQLLGQYDPVFTGMMNEVMQLYRGVFETENRWTFLIDGTSRAGIEAAICSLIEPGERVLVPSFGRFGQLLKEISLRCGADVRVIQKEWGQVFTPEDLEAGLKEHRPKLVAVCQGDTSTTMNQPLDFFGRICHEYDALCYVDCTASIAGNALPVDAWDLDVVSGGLQKCLGGPSGSAPITLNEKAARVIKRRWHIEEGIRPAGFVPGEGPKIQSNYLDLSMIMAYWSEQRLNHHTEATSMLYCARECARNALQEGNAHCVARHELGGRAMMAGLEAIGLRFFGDLSSKMNNVVGVYIPEGVDGEALRGELLHRYGIEIGTSFGPLHGKIWRIGTMGYNCREQAILVTLSALASILRRHGFTPLDPDPAAAAIAVYDQAKQPAATAVASAPAELSTLS